MAENEQAFMRDEYLDEIQAYLSIGRDLFAEMERNTFSANESYAQVLCFRCKALTEGLVIISRNPLWPQQFVEDMCELVLKFQRLYNIYDERFDVFRVEDSQYSCDRETRRDNGKGRPKFLIPLRQLVGLRCLNFTWKAIAEMLGVSEKTVLRRRQEFSMPVGRSNYSNATDEELDQTIASILAASPNSGERMVMGALTARNIKVQRERVRSSINRVDPVNRKLRRHTSIHRRVYSVPTPNALWHLDGNHKLIRWRMVVHGGVDGFSRSIVYLSCTNNNEARTVLEQFIIGTRTFHWPRRIRTDHGTENIQVARLMIQKYGVTSNAVITGRSVHNQRIERMWRDVFSYVLQHYHNLFHYLETENQLDPNDEVHCLALQFIFLPRINRALDHFTTQWNNHPLSTGGNRSPLQLWTAGFYQFAESDYRAVRDVLDVPSTNFDLYGIDDDGPLPPYQTDNHVVVPRSLVQLTEEESTSLDNQVVPLDDDGNYGINLYLRTINLIGDFLNERGSDA